MNRIAQSFLPLCIFSLVGCASVKVETLAQIPPDQIAAGKHYFLRVQTGDPTMNQLLYEFSFHEVGRLLELVEKEELADGTMDIIFTTVGQNKTTGSGVGIASATGWYTGSGISSAAGLGSSFYSTETKTKQLSTMVVAIKEKDGKRLWWADLDLKGKGSVKTPSGSARYLAKKLASVMEDANFKPLPKS